MKKINFLLISISFFLLFTACASRKNKETITNSYTEEYTLPKETPTIEQGAERSSEIIPEARLAPLSEENSTSPNAPVLSEDQQAETQTPNNVAKKPQTEEEKEKIKQILREKIKAQKQKGGGR